MKSMMIALFAMTATLAPSLSHAQEMGDACAPIFKACEAQGFMKDKDAAPGKKIWADCADVLINKKQSVPKISLDAKVVTRCQNFKKAKDQFEKEWNAKNPA